MAINPNSAFVQVRFDLPTPIAIQLDEAVKNSGKSKKQFLADIISSAVSTTKTKVKAK